MTGQIIPPIPGSVLQGPVLETFAPQHNIVTAITNAENAQVTTATDHGYETGMVVRLIVPETYGMELFEQTSIVVTGATTFTTDIDTSNLDPFVDPALYPPQAYTQAQVTPITGTEMNTS